MTVLVFFIIIWEAPEPPNPEYGIELAFTLNAVAPRSPSSTMKSKTKPLTKNESAKQASQSQVNDSSSSEQLIGDIPDEIKNNSSEPVSESIKESNDSDVVDNAPEVEEMEELDENSDEEEVNEDIQEETHEPIIDERSLYKKNTPISKNGDGNSSSEQGASLSMSGWIWDRKPDPKDTSAESGKITYNITVDSDGYLVKIEIVRSTVSPSLEKIYRESIQNLTFSKTSSFTSAPLSKGQITFIIKTK